MGASQQAIIEATEAIRLKPDEFVAHLKLGKALEQQEAFHEWSHGESINHFRKVIELEPDLSEVHFELGSALLENWRKHAGMPRNVPVEDETNIAARAELFQGVEALRRAVSLEPGNAKWHQGLAKAFAV
jgi:tetratricopeptide (TPR) repeat protein